MTVVARRYPLGALLLIAACAETGPTGQGALRVTTVTTGAELDDEYRLDITQGGGGEFGPIGSNATYVRAPLHAGPVSVSLYDVASNCTLTGSSARTLSISSGDTVSTTFQASCVAVTAQVVVRISTTGVDRDVDGYIVALDDTPLGRRNVAIVDSLAFSKVPPGTHRVALRAVAANCAASPDTAQTATLAAGDTLRIAWTVACTLATDRRLVFQEAGEIYVRNPGDTLLVNVTNHPANDVLPAWSPDGTAIAFVSNRSGNEEIYTVRPDGSGVTNLTNNPTGDSFPTWSADGTRIVFVSDRDGNNEIYVMNADGTGQTRLTKDTMPDNFPTFSPDGMKIAFLRGCLTCPPGADVYLMDANGSGATPLTTAARALYWPVWSPDGGRIAFTSGDNVVVMDPDGSHVVQLSAFSPIYGASPTWSPDGSRFAFENGGSIYVANRDGSGMTRLYVPPGGLYTSGPHGGHTPNMSQDGSRIAFVVFYGCGQYCLGFTDLALIKRDGTGWVRLTNGHWVARPAWSPK